MLIMGCPVTPYAANAADGGGIMQGAGAVASDESSDAREIISDTQVERDYAFESALRAAAADSKDGYLLSPSQKSYNAPGAASKYTSAAYASSYDSVSYSSLSATKMPATRDQGSYGNCWAYATLASLEFSEISRGRAASSIDLNELLLSYFAFNTATDPLDGTKGDTVSWNNSKYGNVFNIGANFYMSAALLTRWVGAANQSVFSDYSKAISPGVDSSYAYGYDAIHVNDVYYLSLDMGDYSGANAVKDMIARYGAVGTSMYMSSGTYANYYNAGNNCYYCVSKGSAITVNHGISIVGWDDDFPASSFNSTNMPQSDGAWLVRNSWSTTTARSANSYFWVSYEDASVGYQSAGASDRVFFVYLGEDKSDWHDNNYQYDGSTISDGSDKKTAANIFTASSGAAYEYLDEVSFEVEKPDTTYDIKVYTHIAEGASPESGLLACDVSGNLSYAGYNSVDLGRTIQLTGGERFSVIVTTSASTGVCREYGVAYSQSQNVYETKISVPDYSSYYLESGLWHKVAVAVDSYGYGNFCIKAFTKNSSTPLDTAPSEMKVSQDDTHPDTTLVSSWKAPSGLSTADVYEIYKSSDEAPSGFEKIGDLSVNASSYSDSTLTGAQTVTYLIRTVDADTGNVADCYAEGTTAVTAPVFTAVTNMADGIRLSWKAVYGADGYILQRYRAAGIWDTLLQDTTELSYTDSAVTSGNIYKYRIAAVAGGAYGAWSAQASLIRLDSVSLSLKNVKKGIRLSWSKAAGASEYRVYRKEKEGASWRLIAVKSPTARNYTDKSAKNAKKYIYFVQSVYADASTGITAYGELATSGTTFIRLKAPTVRSAVRLSSKNKAKVKWGKVSGVSGYQIKVKVGSKSYTYNVSSASRVKKTVGHIKSGKSAKIYVRAYKKSASKKYYSAWSEVVKV